ncbi:MAG: hypothetical protein MUE94_01840 [Verrucomicrobia bacterium]|jgi:hypothetical protein|nr:hypothetical protein [Verrucomicrobiota bacterium]
MSFFVHALFMGSLVWLTLHFQRRLPLREDETEAVRVRAFLEWAGQGVAVPMGGWFLANLGLASWLPPFLPEVDVAKNAGGPWFWKALGLASPGMSVIASYWSAVSLAGMLWTIRAGTEHPADFNSTALVWSVFMLPVSALALWVGGASAAGLAVVIWLAPVVRATLPVMTSPKRTPSYAQAIARIKFGKYAEAEWEVLRELEQCENDFNGWMMLAELYAVHFHDFQQAEQTVNDLCAQPDLSPSDACVALHRLADWHLQLRNDPQGARRCLEVICQRYPGTHLDRMARLRLNRIPPTAEEWLEQQQAKPVHLPALHDDWAEPGIHDEAGMDRARTRAEVLSHTLTRNPDDTGAREEFARALGRLGKLDAAIEQVDLLLAMDGQPPARRAEWMGLKAAWTLQQSTKDPAGRELLQRILIEFPDSPQALAARRRILLMDEQSRVAKYAARRKPPKIVIRVDDPARPAPDRGQ